MKKTASSVDRNIQTLNNKKHVLRKNEQLIKAAFGDITFNDNTYANNAIKLAILKGLENTAYMEVQGKFSKDLRLATYGPRHVMTPVITPASQMLCYYRVK